MNDDTFYINLRKNKPEILKSYITQLRDCFTAGYTMPQFCIDNNIKRPLFVALNEIYKNFLWELHIQFQYDRRILAEFALIQGKKEEVNLASIPGNVQDMQLKNVSELNTEDYDKIIILTAGGKPNQNIIYLEQLVNYAANRAEADIPLLHFIQQNPGVKVIQLHLPYLPANKNLNENEKNIIALYKKSDYLVGNFRAEIESAKAEGKIISTPYDFLGYSNSEVYNLLDTPGRKVNFDGSVSLNDNEFLNIRNGKRVTAYQPKNYENRVFFVGNCVLFGYGVPYDKTVESHLQKMLNENNLPYRVENESQFTAKQREDTFYILNHLKTKPGDIIFVMPGRYAQHIPLLDASNILDRPHNYGEVFSDICHINEVGHKVLAEYIFKFLFSNNFFKETDFIYPSPPPPPHRYGIPKENSFDATNLFSIEELEEYKKELREKRVPIGSVLMNCNPFTLGHEYLVEYASARVYKLYIFVVEADLSEFPFAERFEMVKRGVKKFSNVEVLPSRQFAASMKTISGYFNRPEIVDETVDTSTDAYVFANEIAPSLGINMRFVGEENSDAFTHKYNESLKSILPQYGIKVYEIPRKEVNGEAISAKKIRAALNVGDFDTVAKFVPVTTLEFLKQNYSKK